MKDSMFNEGLKCHVISLEYDFKVRTGRLYMPTVNCCDMSGCLKIFEAINPWINCIDTYADGKIDVRYKKNQHNRWKSYLF